MRQGNRKASLPLSREPEAAPQKSLALCTQFLHILTRTVIEPEKLHCYNANVMRTTAHLNIQKG